jgi:dehydrogenase/reductase SDR family member 1
MKNAVGSTRWTAFLVLVGIVASCSIRGGWAFSFPSPPTPATTTTTNRSPRQQPTDERLLQGCVCLVTGASRGIGKGIAVELGKQGAIVYITGTSSLSKQKKSTGPYATSPDVGGRGTIEETAELVTLAGGVGIPVFCNHAKDDEVQALMDQIQVEYGRLDILVNNVFRIPPGAPRTLQGKFWEQGPDTWDTVHTVGLRSHFVASCFAMPLLRQAEKAPLPSTRLARPLIAMISSFGGLTYTFNLPYGVAKCAVDRLAKDMGMELQEENICCTSFWPGLVMTERTEDTLKSGDWDKYVGLPVDKAESPEFTGRAIVAVATDPKNLQTKSGTYQVVAELAQEYGFTDVDGKCPPSIRSLKFLLPTYGMTEEQRKSFPESLIPDWKLPFWMMSQGQPPKS